MRIGISKTLALSILASMFFAGSSGLAENLEVKGSSTIYPVVKEAAKPFAQKTKHVLLVEGGGSGFGIKHAEEGKGLGMASRALKSEETGKGLVGSLIGYDGLAVMVHPDNKIAAIKKDDLAKVFSGEIDDWSKIGGDAGKIVLLGPNTDHGTYDAFVDILKLKDKVSKAFKGFQSHRETMFNVDKDKNAIGIAPLGHYEKFVLEEKKFKLKALTVEGVEPNKENSKSGKYPLVRQLNLVTKGAPAGVAKEFVEFMLTDDGQKLVEQFDFIKLK